MNRFVTDSSIHKNHERHYNKTRVCVRERFTTYYGRLLY